MPPKLDDFAIQLGITFVPVSRATKKPYHEDWTNRTFGDADYKDDDNVGAQWGKRSNDLIDIDCDSIHAARIAEQLIRQGPRYGRPSNQRTHYVLRSPGAKTKQFINPLVVMKKMIIEIRSTGAQSVLPGSIHETGELYAWERQEMPFAVDAMKLVSVIGEIAACALIASLWGNGNRHALSLAFAGFLVKRRVPEDRAKRLFQLVVIGAADDESNDRLRALEDTYRRYADGDDVKGSLADVLGDDAAKVEKALSHWLELERDRFQIHNETTLLTRPEAPFLVKGLLVRGSLVALISPPDVGKTFLTLDLMLNVAANQPTFLGSALRAHGPVLYVMGEGSGRFKLRVLAWKQARGVNHMLPFHWIDQPVPLLELATKEKSMRSFMRNVAQLKPVVIAFDTLSRCLAGGDENSAQDMSSAISVCDEVRARTSALVMLLHHMRKDGTVERGSSALRGAVDTILMLEENQKERGQLTLKCERQKDADQFPDIALRREVVQLRGMADEDGVPMSSCVIELEADGVDREEERRARIINLVRNAGANGISKNKLAMEMGGKRTTALEQIEALIGGRVLQFNDKGKLVEGLGL